MSSIHVFSNYETVRDSVTVQMGNVHSADYSCDWKRDQCVMVAQLRIGHSPLLAGCLHRIGCWDSATCPHCNGTDETTEHLGLQCPAYDQAQRDVWPGGKFNADPRCLWDFLEQIGVDSPPPTPRLGMRERL